MAGELKHEAPFHTCASEDAGGAGRTPARTGARRYRAARAAFDEAVVSLIRLFREHVDGAAVVATRIAREYASGADARSHCTTVDCAQRILRIARAAHEQYLVDTSSEQTAGPAGL